MANNATRQSCSVNLLVDACNQGDIETVRQFLDEGRIDSLTEEGESLLSAACSAGCYFLVEMILDMGADIEDRGHKDTTPLMEAANSGHADIVKLLIDRNANLNAQTNQDNTPLIMAATNGHTECVRLLLEAGAPAETHNESGHNALMEAASNGHVEIAKLLISHGASINTHSQEFKESALTLACYKGQLEMVKFLLEAGADQEHKTEEMHTALMEASMDGHVEVARLLLDSGAQVTMPADSFESPLTLAACGGHVELAMLLLERGANIEEVNDEGYTPLMEAAREGHEEMVALLLSQGADINAQTDETLETALTLACCGGFLDVVDFLVKAGADISAGANTPLMEAAQEGHVELVKYLVSARADVNAATSSGDTALMYACDSGHIKVAECLLNAGADIEHEAEGGRTPLMKACRSGHVQMVEFLISRGADVNRSSLNGEHTPLSLACSNGHLEVVEILLANGADPTHRLRDSSTMLIEAAKGGHTTIVQLLIDYPNSLQTSPIASVPITAASPPIATSNSISTNLDGQNPDVNGRIQRTDTDTGQDVSPASSSSNPTNADNAPATKSTNTDYAPFNNLFSKVAQTSVWHQAVSAALSNLQQQHTAGSPMFQAQEQQRTQTTPSESISDTAQCGPSPPSNDIEAINSTWHNGALADLAVLGDSIGILHEFSQCNEQSNTTATSSGGRISSGPSSPVSPPSPTTSDLGVSKDNSSQVSATNSVTQSLSSFCNHLSEPKPFRNGSDELPLPPIPSSLRSTPRKSKYVGKQTKSAKRHIRTTQIEQSPQASQNNQNEYQQQPSALHQQTGSSSNGENVNTSSVLSPASWYPPIEVDSQTDSNHDTALTVACSGGHEELVQLLLNRGADVEHRDKKGFTPMMLAATAGHAKIVDILLSNGADLESQSERTKDTALSLACSSGRLEVVEILLARGSNKEHRNVSDYTPLSLAASGGYVSIIKLLLNNGAEINSRTGSKLGISPLMLAAMNGHAATVKLLLDMGSDINAQIETNRNTALTLACFQGRVDVVSLLLDRKANAEHRAKTGLTPLMEAASGGFVDVGRVLLDKGADVNALPVPSSRDTALTIAADKGHCKFVELLLQRGAACDVKNKKGNSPLWLACNGGHLDVVQLLLHAGADVDSQDNRKVSCLMAAFRRGHVKVVKVMVKHVTQFPSDQEINRFLALVTDEATLKKCHQCLDIIHQAKERQAAEANKHANILLQEIDQERSREETRKAAAARRREKKRQKKKEKQEQMRAKTDSKDNKKDAKKTRNPRSVNNVKSVDSSSSSDSNSSSSDSDDDSRIIDGESDDFLDRDLLANSIITKRLMAKQQHVSSTSKRGQVKPLTSRPSTQLTNQSQNASKQSVSAKINGTQSKRPGNHIKSKDGTDDSSRSEFSSSFRNNSAGNSDDYRSKSHSTTRTSSAPESASYSKSGSSLKSIAKQSMSTLSNENQPPLSSSLTKKSQKRDEGWKELVRKSKKVVVPANAISRVIGRAGCNINTVREVSCAHIEVEKQKGQADRSVIIKGSAEATRIAQQLIHSLINEPNKDLTEVIKELGLPCPRSNFVITSGNKSTSPATAMATTGFVKNNFISSNSSNSSLTSVGVWTNSTAASIMSTSAITTQSPVTNTVTVPQVSQFDRSPGPPGLAHKAMIPGLNDTILGVPLLGGLQNAIDTNHVSLPQAPSASANEGSGLYAAPEYTPFNNMFSNLEWLKTSRQY